MSGSERTGRRLGAIGEIGEQEREKKRGEEGSRRVNKVEKKKVWCDDVKKAGYGCCDMRCTSACFTKPVHY